MFDFSKAIVIGNEFRHPLRPSAQKWLADHVLPGRYFGISWDRCDIITFRNRAIRDVALPKAAELGAELVLFIDNDVTITHPGVEHFLATEGDVVACRCRLYSATPWARRDSFHTPFWFARIDVFRVLPPPWFQFVHSADGCELVRCECQFFRDRAVAAGFTVRSGGWCGHGCEGRWRGQGCEGKWCG
jgi:hypothetical protein